MNYRSLVRAIRSRETDKGIICADRWLKELTQCVGGNCVLGLLEGVTPAMWSGLLKAAGQKLTYNDVGMVVSEGGVWTAAGIKALDGNTLPPHTIATFPAIVTTTTQDRDSDVLESKGAKPDPLAPLLWQHIPDMPIGRTIAFDAPTDRMVRGQFTIANTALGQDAALLAEHGALRISHGFLPTKWEPLDNRDPFSGYHILEFKILEVSLVSVPSNPDAVIEAFSREKLTHPLVKAWAGAKFKDRPTIQAVGIDLRALPPGTTITLPGTVSINEWREQNKPSPADKCTCHLDKQRTDLRSKDVLPFHDAPVSKSDAWDADAAVKGVRNWAGVNEENPTAAAWEKYGQAFALCVGDKDKLTSYKLPYKQVEDGKLVINPRGVSAGIGALNGGRGGGMDISESDRKGAYNTLVKAYKKAYPDQEPPELKAFDVWLKGLYVDLPGSFERTSDQLASKLKPYLLYKGKAGEADYVSLAATYADRGVACVLEDALMPGQGYSVWDDANATYFEIAWGMANGEPSWTGEPTEKALGELLGSGAKAAYELFVKGYMKASQLNKLKSASDRLEKAYDHEDAKAGPKLHLKRAKAHVDAVVAAHDADGDDDGDEKGFVTDAHRQRLEKASAFCTKAMDHADTTEPMMKHIKTAKAHIDGVMDAHDDGDEGEEEKQLRLIKEGRAVSAANEKRLRSAQSHLKEVADDGDAHQDVAQHASDGVDAIDQIFTIGQGGDSGNDYDQDGNYTGTDMGAYTDGEANRSVALTLKAAILTASGDLPDNIKAALSKARMAMAKKALGHAEAIKAHEAATEEHKGHAMVAAKKLRDTMGEGAGSNDGPAMGTDTSTAEPGRGEPEKSFIEVAPDLADRAWFALAENDEATIFDLDESFPSIERLYGAARQARREVEAAVKEAQLDAAMDRADAAVDRELDAIDALA